MIEKYMTYKNKYPYHVILIKSGNFWVIYENDAIILKYIYNYEIRNNRICFPNKVLNKNLSKLKRLNLNYVLVYELNDIMVIDNINNSYTFLLDKYIELYNLELNYNKLMNLINKKIKYNNLYIKELYNYIISNY